MYYFTTYFDKNYLSRGLVHIHSLKEQKVDFQLFVLALDEFVFDFFCKEHTDCVTPIKLTELENYDKELFAIKETRSKVEYYFTITPCLVLYVIEKFSYIDMITYTDADIYFFDSPKRIFDAMGDNSVVVIPHHFSKKNEWGNVYGKYNVVFNTFKRDKDGLFCLKWWRENCIEWCYDELDEENERFADQKYIEKFPIISDKVFVFDKPTANLAPFNLDNVEFDYRNNTYIVNKEKLVFYHFHYLKRVNEYFYEVYYPAGWLKEYFDIKAVRAIYRKYIRRLQIEESKFGLEFFNSRYKLKEIKFLDKMIYENMLLHTMFYTKFVNVKNMYSLYSKLKNKWQR